MKLENGKKLIDLKTGTSYELKPAKKYGFPYGFAIVKSEYDGEHWRKKDLRVFATEYSAIYWFNNKRKNDF